MSANEPDKKSYDEVQKIIDAQIDRIKEVPDSEYATYLDKPIPKTSSCVLKKMFEKLVKRKE